MPQAQAAAWTEYRVGPLYIMSDSGDGAARERLTEMEQIRWVLGNFLGRNALGTRELDTIFPIELVLFNHEDDADRFNSGTPFFEGGSANLSVAHDDDDLRSPGTIAWRHELVRQLLQDNAGVMPPDFETALADIFSTIQVDNTHVELGAPLPEGILDPVRQRAWARYHMLVTGEQYAGRFRIFLNNLQGGDMELAARNTYGVSAVELNRRMDAYADAGDFKAVSVFGKAINPIREFYERRLPDEEVEALMQELAAQGKSFPPDSPRGLVAAGDVESLRLAAARNPRWALPYVRLADYEPTPEAKASRLEKAVELEPRQIDYWVSLAENDAAAGKFTEAAQAWLGAQRATASPEQRAELEQRRREIEDKRVDAELAAQAAAQAARDAEVERVRRETAERIQAVLDRANKENRELSSAPDPDEKAAVSFEEAYGGPATVRGVLTQVGCVDGYLRLIVRQTGGELAVLRMVPPEDLETAAANDDPVLRCGAVDPPRLIEVVHDGYPDDRLGTAGTVQRYILR